MPGEWQTWVYKINMLFNNTSLTVIEEIRSICVYFKAEQSNLLLRPDLPLNCAESRATCLSAGELEKSWFQGDGELSTPAPPDHSCWEHVLIA